MSVHPTPSDFEAQSNATFDAVMWALARPGMVRMLPAIGMAQVVDALIDRECAVHCTDPALAVQVQQAGGLNVDACAADHVFATEVAKGLLDQLRCGSDLHPDDGATLVAMADFSAGQKLRLTGPGVDGEEIVTVGGLPTDFWQNRARAMRYPMGFEILLISGQRLLGVPRSTTVEVL